MRILRGRRDPYQNDPLLSRPRVAEFIDRDPARVTRYWHEGSMPASDATTADGSPLWRQSTIRSWWLGRGGRFPDARHRYHQQWEQTGLAPELLEELIVEATETRTDHYVHVRAYRAMDGGGPVLLLGIPEAQYPVIRDWAPILDRVTRTLTTDIELDSPVWLHVEARSRFEAVLESSFGVLPEVEITDLGDRDVTVSAEDVSRLIGRPFDVYPARYYTLRAIAERRASGEQDTAAATPVITDSKHLGTTVRRVRTLVGRAAGLADEDSVKAWLFAAGVLADSATRINARVVENQDWIREYASTGGGPTVPDQDGEVSAYVAVYAQERTFVPAELRLVHSVRLDPPLVLHEENSLPGRVVVLRADAAERLGDLRGVVQDIALAEGTPEREAIEDAEACLRSCMYAADPNFATIDRQPTQITWSSESPEMAAYLAQLHEVVIDDLPYELRRRARLLTTCEYAQDWTGQRLLHDEVVGLVALLGTEPSRLSRRSAEHLAYMHQQPRLAGQPPMTQAGTEAVIAAYLADRPQVRMDWPRAPLNRGTLTLSGVHVLAPSAHWDTYRPVFLRHADGTLQPLPLTDDDFQGFAWGLSGTNSLTRAVHSLITDRPARDWRQFPEQADDPGSSAHAWLNQLIGAQGPDPLDIALDAVLDKYSSLGLT